MYDSEEEKKNLPGNITGNALLFILECNFEYYLILFMDCGGRAIRKGDDHVSAGVFM